MIVGWPAQVAVALQNLFPNEVDELAGLIARFMPRPAVAEPSSIRGEDLQGTIPNLLNRAVPPAARPA